MKKIFPAIIISVLWFNSALGQYPIITGKPIAEIYTDFHYSFNDTSKAVGFGVNRANLGYRFQPDGKLTSTVIVNIGNPEDLAEGTKPTRYAYFREASITYTEEKLTVSFGIASTRIFDFQQRFWGKRYIGPEFQSIYGYGSVADLGVVIDFRINDIIKVDFSLMNGKGYTNFQYDNSLKTSFGVVITTPNRMAFKIYGDVMRPMGITQTTLVAFAGFKTDLISFGAEASYKSNLDKIKGHYAWGVSGTGALNLGKETELFVRYDYAGSAIPDGQTINWNYALDGSFLIYGIQHTFTPNFRMALNYKGNFPYNPLRLGNDAIYLNAHFKF